MPERKWERCGFLGFLFGYDYLMWDAEGRVIAEVRAGWDRWHAYANGRSNEFVSPGAAMRAAEKWLEMGT